MTNEHARESKFIPVAIGLACFLAVPVSLMFLLW